LIGGACKIFLAFSFIEKKFSFNGENPNSHPIKKKAAKSPRDINFDLVVTGKINISFIHSLVKALVCCNKIFC